MFLTDFVPTFGCEKRALPTLDLTRFFVATLLLPTFVEKSPLLVNESGQKGVKFVATIIRDFCKNEVKTVILGVFGLFL